MLCHLRNKYGSNLSKDAQPRTFVSVNFIRPSERLELINVVLSVRILGGPPKISNRYRLAPIASLLFLELISYLL
jgi:hypothetical protein